MSEHDVNDSRPQVPPDSHGNYGRYCDQCEERKVKCAHDNDECSFIKFCPRYEPKNYNHGEYDLAKDTPEKLAATCRLAPTGGIFLRELFNYDSSSELRKFIEVINNGDEDGFKYGKLDNEYDLLSSLEKDMLELLALLKFGGYKDYVELAMANIDLRLKRRAE